MLHAAAAAQAGHILAPEACHTPRASALFALGVPVAERGAFVEPLALTPLYVRRPEPEEKWEKAQGHKAIDGCR